MGVYEFGRFHYQTQFAIDYISSVTARTKDADFKCRNTDECRNNGFDVCLGGMCMKGANVHAHEALSPAFEYDSLVENKMKLVNESSMYPQWVEP